MTTQRYVETRRFTGSFDLHRMMRRRMHVPSPIADNIVRNINRFWNPTQKAVRRTDRIGDAGVQVPDSDGYRIVEPGDLPGGDDVVAYCQQLFESARATWDGPDPNSTKDFLISLVKDSGFAAHAKILMFLISPAMIDTASRYLGRVPRLSTVRLWWTPPNDSIARSQVWHVDPEDKRQLKIFLNIFDITEDQGPFTFYPASRSRPILDAAGIRERHFDDAAVTDAGAPIVLTAPAGGGAFVDTSRCLHFGSRGNRRDRVVLMAQYTDFYAPCVKTASWARAVSDAGIALTDQQKLLLGVE